MQSSEQVKLYKEKYPPFLKWVLSNRGTDAEAQDAFHDAYTACKLYLDAQQATAAADWKRIGRYLSISAEHFYARECKRKGRQVPTDFSERQVSDDENELDDVTGELVHDLSADGQEDSPALSETQEAHLYHPDNWGVVRACLALISVRRCFILTWYFALRFFDARQAWREGELSEHIASLCRVEFGTKDTKNSIDVDKARGMEDLRKALAGKYPDRVRYLKWKWEEARKMREEGKQNAKKPDK